MLVLSRKNGEAVVVGGSPGFEPLCKITVLGITGGRVRLGFEVAAEVPVHREEVWQRMCAERGLDPVKLALTQIPPRPALLPTATAIRLKVPKAGHYPKGSILLPK